MINYGYYFSPKMPKVERFETIEIEDSPPRIKINLRPKVDDRPVTPEMDVRVTGDVIFQ